MDIHIINMSALINSNLSTLICKLNVMTLLVVIDITCFLKSGSLLN
jgi:hypothetical protein